MALQGVEQNVGNPMTVVSTRQILDVLTYVSHSTKRSNDAKAGTRLGHPKIRTKLALPFKRTRHWIHRSWRVRPGKAPPFNSTRF